VLLPRERRAWHEYDASWVPAVGDVEAVVEAVGGQGGVHRTLDVVAERAQRLGARTHDVLVPVLEYVDSRADRVDDEAGIGALELLAAVGLIVRAAFDIAPVLTALAASGVVMLMLGAGATHLRRGVLQMLPVNLVPAGLALFVAIERFGPQSL